MNASDSGQWSRPGRLWSLWEMLEFKANSFIEALSRLGELDAIAAKDASWLYQDKKRAGWLITHLDTVLHHLDMLDLRLSARKARQIRLMISTGGPAEVLAPTISSNLTELRDRIAGELEDRSIYFVDAERAEFLKAGETPFGAAVSDKFPSSATDISEAANCLGLSRNTATVFHLMRAMEDAVNCLGVKLGATTIDKNMATLEWGKILSNVKTAVEAMPKGEERDRWSEAVTLLYHVKQTWRNGTMHPKQTYTGDEARAVYDAVRSFMRHLALLV